MKNYVKILLVILLLIFSGFFAASKVKAGVCSAGTSCNKNADCDVGCTCSFQVSQCGDCVYDANNPQAYLDCLLCKSNTGSCGGSGNTGCGNARAPGCDGGCPPGSACKPKADNLSCVCKAFVDRCNGGYITECKQGTNCSPAGARDGTCYKRNGTKGVYCRVLSCAGSNMTLASPPLTSPTNGSTVSTPTVRLTWKPPVSWGGSCNPPQLNRYFVYAGLDTAGVLQTTILASSGQTYFDYTIPPSYPLGTPILWHIQYSNNCPTFDTNSPIWSFINQGGITGNVYYDAGNTCSSATKWTLTNSLKVSATRTLSANVVNGSYVLPAPPGRYNLGLSGMPAGYICSTGGACNDGGCPRTLSTVSPGTANFYLTYNPGPWWQVKDGDVQSGGDLQSSPPGTNFFDEKGPGGFPGIPTYKGTLTGITPDNVSETKWLAQSSITNEKIYNYQFFMNQVPTDILSTFNTINVGDDVAADLTNPGAQHDNNSDFYYWYKYDGKVNGNQPLTIPAVDIGDRKVIVFVDSADVNITGNITLTDGVGFFMLIVGQDATGNGGSINVAASVGGAIANLEGLYVADDTFSDGTQKPGADDTELHVRGSVVAYRSFALQRDLGAGDLTNPSELFEYAPDQIMLFPKALSVRKINWKEVAP